MSLRNGSRSARQSQQNVSGNRRLALQRACRAALPTVNPGLEALEDRRLFAIQTPVIYLNFDQGPVGAGKGTTVPDQATTDGTAYPQSGVIVGADPAPSIKAGGQVFHKNTTPSANYFDLPNVGNTSQSKRDQGWIDLPDINKYLRTTSSLALWLRVTPGLVSPNGDFWNDPSVAGVEEAGAGDDVFWGHVDEAGRIGVGANGDGAVTPFAVNDGVWRHFVFTRDSATGQNKVYVNGILAATATSQAGDLGTPFRSLGASENRQVNSKADSPLPTTPFGGDPTLGINLGGPTYNFANSAADGMNGRQFLSGSMDEVEIFNKVLTDQDVKDMYASIGPVTPVTNVAAQGSPYGVTVSWDSQPNAAAYRIYRTLWGDLGTPPATRNDYLLTTGQPYTIAGAAAGRVTFKDGDVDPGTNYYYRVVAVNGNGESTDDNPANPLAQAGTSTTFQDVPGAFQYDYSRIGTSGNSFWGRTTRNSPPLPINQIGYITRRNSAGSLNDPVFSEIVSQANFNWGSSPPIIGNNNVSDIGNGDNFSTAFFGRIKVPAAGTYTFLSNSDDDSYLYVNGQLVSFDPQGHGPRDPRSSNSGGGATTITLDKDQVVNFLALQAEQGGGAAEVMQWILPGTTNVATIPASAYVGTLPNAPAATGSATQTPADGRPAAPDNLRLVNNADLGADHYVLNVNDNATNEVRYVLQRRSGTDFPSPTSSADFEIELPASSNPNGAVANLMYAESGVNPGITYYYRLRAENLVGNSDWSNTLAVRPQDRPAKNPPPAAPSDVRTWSFKDKDPITGADKNGVFISFQDNSLFEQGNFGTTNPIIRFEIDRKDLTDPTQNTATGGDNGWVSITGKRGDDPRYDDTFIDSHLASVDPGGPSGDPDHGEALDAFPGGIADFPDLYGHAGTGRVLLFDSNAQVGHTYIYRIRTHTEQFNDPANAYINSTFSPSSLPVTTGPVGGTGFHANYFDNLDFTGTRREFATQPIHFNFGNGAPAGIGADQYSGVLEGEFLAVTTEDYTFLTDSDDGVALRVIDPTGDPTKAPGTPGAQILIDFDNLGARRGLNNGDNPNFQDNAGVASLVRNQRYLIQLRWLEDGGGAGYKLGYKSEIQTNGRQVFVPIDLMRPANSQTPQVAAGNLTSAEALANDKFRLTFRDVNASEDGYRLQRSIDGGTTWIDTTQTGPILTANSNIDIIDDLGQLTDAEKPAIGGTIQYRMITLGISPLGQRTTVPVSITVPGTTATNFVVNGDTAYQNNGTTNTTTDDSIRLVRNVNNVSGSAYLADGRDLIQAGQGPGGSNGFTLDFKFRAHDGSSSQGDPADGFALVFNRDRKAKVGGGGGGLGYTGVTPSVAVKFDAWPGGDAGGRNATGVYAGGNMNDTEIAGTPDANHSVTTSEINKAVPTGLSYATDSKEYKVALAYNADTKTLTETITQVADPTKFVNVTYTGIDLKALMGGEYAWLGFSAGNGGLNEQVDITRFKFNSEQIFGQPDITVGPKVTGVYVRGAGVGTNNWSESFLNWIGDVNNVNPNGDAVGDPVLGYKVTAGERLPWTNLNQISVTFDQDVGASFAAANNKVQVKIRDSSATAGSADTTVSATFVSYSAATKSATYSIPANLPLSKVLVSIRDTDVNFNGAALDGDGNGAAGGNFNFRFDAIPGDVNRSGGITITDTGAVKARQGAIAASDTPIPYSHLLDVNGSGTITITDTGAVKARQGLTITTINGDPTPVGALFSSEPVSLAQQLEEGAALA